MLSFPATSSGFLSGICKGSSFEEGAIWGCWIGRIQVYIGVPPLSKNAYLSAFIMMHHIYIVSDGSGGTADQVLNAALTQFEGKEAVVERRSLVRNEEQIVTVVKEAAEQRAFIVHTIITQELRDAMTRLCRLHDVGAIDLMGPLMTQLALRFHNNPREEPGLFRKLNKDYFERIEAMEFALRHDDGQRAHELERAELVLLGVSRTFKTPLSIYFAFKGWLVANIPIVYNLPLPDAIFDLDPSKVFCLMTDAYHLSELRKSRHEYLGGATGDYADLEFVRRELAYARRLFNSKEGWTTIRVTNKPIEEIASQIRMRVRQRTE